MNFSIFKVLKIKVKPKYECFKLKNGYKFEQKPCLSDIQTKNKR